MGSPYGNMIQPTTAAFIANPMATASSIGPNALIAAIVLPFFYLAVYLDYAISRHQGRDDYEIKDTVGSLGVSIMMSALGTTTILCAWPSTPWPMSIWRCGNGRRRIPGPG